VVPPSLKCFVLSKKQNRVKPRRVPLANCPRLRFTAFKSGKPLRDAWVQRRSMACRRRPVGSEWLTPAPACVYGWLAGPACINAEQIQLTDA
jgi:hypothetical protein